MDAVGLEDAKEWQGLDVFDREGERIGRLSGLYVDRETQMPMFGLVRIGLFGLRSVLVPLAGAFEEGGALIVDLEKHAIRGAPQLRRDETLSDGTELQLYEHYGLEHRSHRQLEPVELEHVR